MLTQAILKENLHYDPETGVFTWIKRTQGRTYGSFAGCSAGFGHIRVRINNKTYAAHRLAWLYMFGFMPSMNVDIDHKNGIPFDNRIKNLRIASRSENIKNCKIYTRNTSGFKGVSWHVRSKKWQVRISVNKKQKTIGFFKTIEDANAFYINSAKDSYKEFFRVT